MSHITTCSACGRCYEESSEESANDPRRLCAACFRREVVNVEAMRRYEDALRRGAYEVRS